ncbi:hypothetical protein B566_EDAN012891 [Ephemera danica]|nr:hypothetical protein B566_EDAN012891 [Ephemera danica]
MDDANKKKVSFGSHTSTKGVESTREVSRRHPNGSKDDASLKKTHRRSTGGLSNRSSHETMKSSSSCPSLQSIKTVSSKATKKSLVRNCNVAHANVLKVSKPHELQVNAQADVETKTKELKDSATRDIDLAVPTKHTILQTSRKIRRVSDLDLEAAYNSIKDLNLLEDDNIDQKVARVTLNVGPNERLFTNLVSVDVADDQLGPKITDIRKHRFRSKRDLEPRLEDYCRPESRHEEDCWPSFPPLNIPFTPVQLYDGTAVLSKISKWQQDTDTLLLFEKS